MTFTWCKSKNKVSRRIEISKGPQQKIDVFKKNPEWFSCITIDFFVIKNI